MGLVVVLIFQAIFWTIAASVGAVFLGGFTSFLTKRCGKDRKRAVRVARLFAFGCVAFAGVWFVAYAVINSVVFHRDPGLGDGWETPMPNGYALMMIDTTDQGTVYDPRTYDHGISINGENSVSGVRQLSVKDGLIFGALDSGYFQRSGQESKLVDRYFELDTNRKTYTEFVSAKELGQRAAGEGVEIHLRPFQSVFDDYRYTWFDYAALSVLLVAPIIGFFFLARWVWMVRRRGNPDELSIQNVEI